MMDDYASVAWRCECSCALVQGQEGLLCSMMLPLQFFGICGSVGWVMESVIFLLLVCGQGLGFFPHLFDGDFFYSESFLCFHFASCMVSFGGPGEPPFSIKNLVINWEYSWTGHVNVMTFLLKIVESKNKQFQGMQSKPNGCLERSKDWLVVVINPDVIVDDVL